MFVICRNGHLGKCWDGNTPLFLEENSGVFPSRKQCLDYLMQKCKMKKEQAVSVILSMQKSECWISF